MSIFENPEIKKLLKYEDTTQQKKEKKVKRADAYSSDKSKFRYMKLAYKNGGVYQEDRPIIEKYFNSMEELKKTETWKKFSTRGYYLQKYRKGKK